MNLKTDGWPPAMHHNKTDRESEIGTQSEDGTGLPKQIAQGIGQLENKEQKECERHAGKIWDAVS